MLDNFNLDWFVTIPGILTVIGCLLIVISIIILLTSLKGKKAPNEEVNSNATNEEPITEPVNNVQTMATEPDAATVEPVNVAPTPVTVEPVNVTPTPVTVEPVNVASTPVTVEPVNVAPTPVTVEPVNVTPTPVTVEPVNVTSTGYSGINLTPDIKPVPPVNDGVTPDITNLPYNGEVPSVEPVLKKTEPTTIYGGANPTLNTEITSNTAASKKAEDIESL